MNEAVNMTVSANEDDKWDAYYFCMMLSFAYNEVLIFGCEGHTKADKMVDR